MADDREIVVGSLITLACNLGATSLLLKKKKEHSAWVKKYIPDREQYGECNILLPELTATDVVKFVQYMRMDIYRSIRGIAIHGWASDSAKIN